MSGADAALENSLSNSNAPAVDLPDFTQGTTLNSKEMLARSAEWSRTAIAAPRFKEVAAESPRALATAVRFGTTVRWRAPTGVLGGETVRSVRGS
jgi:hypothetical protein